MKSDPIPVIISALDTMNRPTLPLEQSLALLADQLRSISNEGAHFSESPYDQERYRRVGDMAAQLQALVDERPLPQIETLFNENVQQLTPLAVVDTAVFTAEARILLIRRADDNLWAMPGGVCEVGEMPAQAAAREVFEETGLSVEITRLLGIFDSRYCGTHSGRHLYHLLFTGVYHHGAISPSHEIKEVAWYDLSEIPWNSLSPGHSLRLQQVMNWWLNRRSQPYFDHPDPL